jgi:ABC-2 type transport system permease protein
VSETIHSEWTKLRTLASTTWLLLGTVALTVGVGAAVVAVTSYTSGPQQDITKTALIGVQTGQAVIAIFSVLAITNEYSTGMICVTLTATPRRLRVLAAKALTVTALAILAGAISVTASLIIGRYVLISNGFTAAHGYSAIALAHPATLRAGAGSVLYLALIALLSLGAATALRDTAAAMGSVLAVLYLFPILVYAVSDPHWQRHLQQIGPMNAGLAISSTIHLHNMVISPWAGLGVLALWAAAGLAGGAIALTLRDG